MQEINDMNLDVGRFLKRSNNNTGKSYEEILNNWRTKRNKSLNVFDGHFLIKLTSEINQIEGINATYNRTREIFENESVGNYTGDIRDLFSVMNNKTLARYYNKCLDNKVPVTPELIKESHRLLMFASIDKHRYEDNGERAGQYKKKDYCVGRYSVGLLPSDIPSAMSELCEITTNIDGHDVLKVATAFHCLFEHYHPFADGNGRVGRWLINYILVLNNHPPVIIYNEDKAKYYECLEKFDREEDYNSMYNYLKEQVVKSYDAFKYLLG